MLEDTRDRGAATVQQDTVKCPSCGSSDVRAATVRSALWHHDRLVVVEDLPALVCGACQERFYDDATVTILDLMRGEGFPEAEADHVISVPVFSFRSQLPGIEKEREGVIR
jgi:YgiT-type zinc finger domain-containing protein